MTGPRHLLSVADLGTAGIAEVLRVAEAFAEVERRSVPKVPTLRGKVVATLFFEESTRTRLSFETAAKRLSADVLSLAVATSSVKKGESLRDTVETVEAMGIDAVIIRHASAGAPHQVARWVERAHVVNAGDGWHEHPTQALLDCFTVRQVLAERKGVAPEELGIGCFEGLRVLIVGDVRHSRVARSEVLAYTALGAHVILAAPGSLLPPSLEGWPVEVATDLDAALGDADVVSLLRLQAERGSGSFVPSLREYTAGWGLTARRAERLGEDAIVTHPGPMVRGVEIASDVADLPRTVVTQQVANGVAVRMAILFLLLGEKFPALRGCPRLPDATLVIRGGTVVGPVGSARLDVAVCGDTVVGLAESIEPPQRAVVLDAAGCLVGPGLVDLHTHLRQPGREEAETVETGARAAALGGYTAVVAMPNTEPTIDSAGAASEVLALGTGCVAEVAVAGAITLARAGTALAPLGELAALGVTLFTDDGVGVQDGALMRRALDYAKGLGVTLAQHCEDACLAAGGAMHEGSWSSRLGIPGMPAAAEEAMVARDITLARLTGAPVHFLHLSTAGSVELVRRAKAEGLPVTAEAAPHHMLLTHSAVAGYDTVFKVNPPLRTDEDVAAVVAGLCDGTIDAVATDHAPHAPESKEVPFDQAPPGMLGLQTALPIAWEVLSPHMGAERVFALMSAQPAVIAKLTATDARAAGHSAQGGPVEVGAVANLCVFDPAATTVVDPTRLASRSRNTPYAGRSFAGAVRHTVLRGEAVVIDAVAQR